MGPGGHLVHPDRAVLIQEEFYGEEADDVHPLRHALSQRGEARVRIPVHRGGAEKELDEVGGGVEFHLDAGEGPDLPAGGAGDDDGDLLIDVGHLFQQAGDGEELLRQVRFGTDDGDALTVVPARPGLLHEG